MAGGVEERAGAYGHKTIQMTCGYAHLAPLHQLAAIERLCETREVSEASSEEPNTRTDTGASEQSGEAAADVEEVISFSRLQANAGL